MRTNETRELYKTIDAEFTKTLQKHGLAYSLKKYRYEATWKVQIGKFNSITDPFIQGAISFFLKGRYPDQFRSILKKAIKDELVNYPEAKKAV